MKKLLLGILIGLCIPALVGGLVLVTGTFNMAATESPLAIERTIGEFAVNRYLARRVPERPGKHPVTGHIKQQKLSNRNDSSCILLAFSQIVSRTTHLKQELNDFC